MDAGYPGGKLTVSSHICQYRIRCSLLAITQQRMSGTVKHIKALLQAVAMLLRREIIPRNTVNDRQIDGRLLDIATGVSVRLFDDQTVLIVGVLRNTCRFQCLGIQHNPVSAV